MNIEVVKFSHYDDVDIRDTGHPDKEVLHLSAAARIEFLAAAKRGDFDQVVPSSKARRARLC